MFFRWLWLRVWLKLFIEWFTKLYLNLFRIAINFFYNSWRLDLWFIWIQWYNWVIALKSFTWNLREDHSSLTTWIRWQTNQISHVVSYALFSIFYKLSCLWSRCFIYFIVSIAFLNAFIYLIAFRRCFILSTSSWFKRNLKSYSDFSFF